MENKDNKIKQIDVVAIIRLMWQHKKLYYIALPIVFVLSCLIIVCVPRYYTSTAKLAPELSSFNSSSLGDIASSFGFDIGGASNNNGDAIFPELYPELISSNDFLVSMFDVKVKSDDGSINTNYYDYLAKKQQTAWWTKAFYGIKSLFSKNDSTSTESKVNPFKLTKAQNDVAQLIASKVSCTVDKKNYVISISVEDQDPLIAATIADTVQVRLQQFITDYRTSKAKKDLDYYKKLCATAKSKYEKTRQTYGSYADANQDVILESYKLKENDLENEMQLLYNNYTAMQTQVQQAQAKLLMQTPAFTTLQNASVPLKPSGPKRMIFVLAMTFVAFMIITIYSIRDIIFTEE